MNRLTIKMRVTLWYACLLLLICLLLFTVMNLAANGAAREYCRQTLQNALTMVKDELEYEDGRLEIQSGIDEIPNVYATLFRADGSVLYGRQRVPDAFEEGVMRRTTYGGHSWYILDERLEYREGEEIWLRVYTSTDVSWDAQLSMLRYGFWFFPLLAAFALAGGHALTARAFRPVKEMTALAGSIAGGEDLSRRIGLGGGKDELHALSDTFDAMLERLERSFHRERRFTSDVAHELRTPMNAIRTQCEYGLSREQASQKDEAFKRILERNEEMDALVRQLLLIARTESGQMPRDDHFRLDEMLEQVAEDFVPVAAERRMRIQTQLTPCPAVGNRALLARAFINLLDNAIRYGREGGEISVKMALAPQEVSVTVENEGDDISPEDLPKLFDRFWRADASRTTPGTGIGLSLVKSAVEAHGGSVTAQSGEGMTRFCVRLPLEGSEEKK